MRRRLQRGDTANPDVDDRAIEDLLASVRDVRTTLALELSAAAGALDDERPEVARDILAATAAEIAAIADHSRGDSLLPRNTRGGISPRRVWLALPVLPLVSAVAMTAAAAVGVAEVRGHHSQHITHHAAIVTATSARHPVVAAHVPSTGSAAHTAATTTLHRLESVVRHDPRAEQVLAIAADLHQQLTAMIATATNDPARLHVVQHLLTLEQQVLEASKVPGTQVALAASREIARLLATTPSKPSHGRQATARSKQHQTVGPASPMPRATAATSHRAPTIRRQPTATPKHATTATKTPTTTPKRLFGSGLFNDVAKHDKHARPYDGS